MINSIYEVKYDIYISVDTIWTAFILFLANQCWSLVTGGKSQAHKSVLHVFVIHREPLLEAEQFDFVSNGSQQQPTAQMWGGCHTCKISSSQQPYDEDSVASVFHVRKLTAQGATTRQQQSGKLTLLELTRNLFFSHSISKDGRVSPCASRDWKAWAKSHA